MAETNDTFQIPTMKTPAPAGNFGYTEFAPQQPVASEPETTPLTPEEQARFDALTSALSANHVDEKATENVDHHRMEETPEPAVEPSTERERSVGSGVIATAEARAIPQQIERVTQEARDSAIETTPAKLETGVMIGMIGQMAQLVAEMRRIEQELSAEAARRER